MTMPDPQEVVAAPPGEVRTVVIGLILALTLAALDQNIVGVALPQIVSDLGGLAHLSWVVTSFMVTSTATTPLYGKLSDLYGRKPLFITAILIFLVGSSLCGLSRSMAELVVFRGIQGIGAGGLMTLAMTTIADLVAPRERGKYQGLFGAAFAFSSIAGPLLGGFITSVLSWRWIFYVNLPVGCLALFFFIFGFHRPHRRVTHRIDYLGVVFLTSGTVALLLVLSMGGVQFPWSSPLILGLAVSAAVLCYLLVATERRSAEPIFSPLLFQSRVFIIAAGTMAVTFMGLFGAAVFLPLFFQLVLGYAPAQAGLMMAPMTVGVVVSSFLGGRLVSLTGRYKVFPVVGLAAASLAYLAVMAAATFRASTSIIEASLIVLGLGFGLVMPNLMVAIQNSVSIRELGAATAASTFFRSLGGTFGVAMSGAIMTAQLHGLHLVDHTGARSLLERGLQEIAQLPAVQRNTVIETYRHAIATTFLVGAVISALAFAIVLFLPEHPLRSGQHERKKHDGA
ncbi:MAG TPA: MDR family MFS transporter [Nitrospirota bacterium]|nr:MDR family MFS transporter [Nitrospirota bacterium]